MSKKNEAWGVEVGAQAIKVMKLARAGNGVVMEDFEVLPFKHVLTTPDLNVEEAIRVNLESLSQKHEFDKSTVVVSVPGHMAFARFAKLPPIEASKVKSIVAYEAQQQIPFPIDQVEWDYHVFEVEDAPDIEVGIFAITKEKVAHFLSNYRSVGMRVDALTLSPVAVYNAFAYESGAEGAEGGSTVYLDIGTVSTDIIVVEAGGIWLRTLPLGGNHFTNALMKQFKISFAKAEKLKLEASTSKYAKQIFQAMRGVFSDLVSEIQRSLGFYQSLNRDAELSRIVGVGSTWKLPGLQKFLKQNLQMEVIRPDGFTRLEVDGRRAAEFSSVAVNMATAYGLALQGLGLAGVEANILPQTILRQRMWKAKQPAFAAAAACVVAGAIIAPVRVFMADSSFETAWDRVKPEISSTISTAQGFKTEYDEKVTPQDPRPAIRNYRRSVDYVNLYPKLIEDVTSAMHTLPTNPQLSNIDWNQPEDIAKVAQIPRTDRDQVWVTNITTTYKMPKPAAAGEVDLSAELPPPPEDLSGSGFDEFGDTTYLPDSGFGGGSTAGLEHLTPVPFPSAASDGFDAVVDEPVDEFAVGEGEGDTGTATPAQPAKPDLSQMPRIIVTVRGQTTMDPPTIARLLEQNFEDWLEKNAERKDRPYILVADVTNTQYEPLSRISLTGSDSGFAPAGNLDGFGTGEEGLRRTPTPKIEQPVDQFNPGGITTPGGLGGLGGLGGTGGFDGGTTQQDIEIQTPEGWYAKLGSAGGYSVGALLPRRPLSVEDNLSDTQFTFSFEVILLSPDEARKTILPAKAIDLDQEKDDTDTQPAQPTEPTAAADSRADAQQEQNS